MPTRAVNIRVDEELYQYLQDRAEKEHRSVSNMIISILIDARLDQEREELKKKRDTAWNEAFKQYRETSMELGREIKEEITR